MYSFIPLDPEDRIVLLDRSNPLCKFNKVVGQDVAIRELLTICHEAFGNRQHLVKENIVLTGLPGLGKSYLSEILADQLGVVFCKTDGTQIRKNDHMIEKILEAWAMQREPLVPDKRSGDVILYKVPPMVCHIDETHALAGSDAEDGLLKATERSDGMLFGKKTVLDCKDVLWVASTTDFYDLTAPFRSRFQAYQISLVPYDEKQVAQIVQKNNPTWGHDICREMVKWFGKNPRVVLGFCRRVQRRANMLGGNLKSAILDLVKDERIDEFGMRFQQLAILKALLGRPHGVLLRHLLPVCQTTSTKEVTDGFLPDLLLAGHVSYDKSKYFLEPSGLQELQKRGLA